MAPTIAPGATPRARNPRAGTLVFGVVTGARQHCLAKARGAHGMGRTGG